MGITIALAQMAVIPGEADANLSTAQALAAEQLKTFIDFPPRQKPAAFNLDRILESMKDASGGGMH